MPKKLMIKLLSKYAEMFSNRCCYRRMGLVAHNYIIYMFIQPVSYPPHYDILAELKLSMI